MSLLQKKQDTNYWPSISDLFLVFFVIALVILSQKTSIQQEGEKLIIHEVVSESNIIFKWVDKNQNPTPFINPVYDLSMDINNRADYPILAEMLYKSYIYIDEKIADSQVIDTAVYESFRYHYEQQEIKNYRDSIKLLYLKLGGDIEDFKHAIYDEYLVFVRSQLINLPSNVFNTKSLYPNDLNQEDMKKIMEEQKRMISKLETQIKTLSANSSGQLAIYLQNQIDILTKELKNAKIKNEDLARQLETAKQDSIVIGPELRSALISLTSSSKSSSNKELLYKLQTMAENETFKVETKPLDEKDITFAKGKESPMYPSVGQYLIPDPNRALRTVRGEILDNLQKLHRINRINNSPNSTSIQENRLYIEICGHTDETSSKSFNAHLGLKRAKWLRDELKQQFSGNGDIVWTVRSAGETQLIHYNYKDIEENKSASRRIEIKMWIDKKPDQQYIVEIPDGVRRKKTYQINY